MKTIPEAVLIKIASHRPYLTAMIDNLRGQPVMARQIEQAIARAYLAAETRLTAMETYRLAAVANGQPWPVVE